jgi:ribonuclease HI
LDTYYEGFSLKFVIRSDKDVAAFNDRSNIVVLDKRNGIYESYAIDECMGENLIYKVFTDASYFEKRGASGIAFIIEDIDGNYQLHTEKTKILGSSQAELEAVKKALIFLEEIDKIRIVTDSQYVRKGLTEWIPFWRLNDFKTVNGEKAKNIDNWIETDRVCCGKYIEFQWVKGHSEHFENSLCDMYAKDEGRKL